MPKWMFTVFCLFVYAETGVLRAYKRFLFLFAVVFLREAKERA